MNKVLLDNFVNDSTISTPTLVLDFDIISETYNRFTSLFNDGLVYYAVKANANPLICQMVVERGGGLEIASMAELELALRVGATGNQIICSNPIKNPAFLKRMQAEGVFAVVVDSTYEVEKIAQVAPNLRVYIRLAVDNTGAVLPLAGKFGVSGDMALEIAELAREKGLEVIGLSFHVGSQCLSPVNWVNAIRACGDVWREAQSRGFDFFFLDIGGGFPAGNYHDPSIPTLESIAELVNPAIVEFIPYHPNLMMVMEPGRGLSGESGRLLALVEGKAMRGDDTWLYLDVGVFNGLMETYEGFPPVIRVMAEDAHLREKKVYTLAGPSCDSCDVVARDLELPEIHIGDRLVFLDAGAYVSEYGAAFNGFPVPQVIALNVEKHIGIGNEVERKTAAEEALYNVEPAVLAAPA
jgi:ornithine decarboxylase